MKNLKLLFIGVASLLANCAIAQTIAVSSSTIEKAEAGQTAEIVVSYQPGSEVMSGVQFDIYMPDGLELDEDYEVSDAQSAGGKYNDDLSEKEGFSQFVVYGKKSTYVLTEGELVTFTVKTASGVEAGEKEIKITNLIFTDPDAVAHKIEGDFISTIGVATGINSVSLDDPNAEVYNLNGQRINGKTAKKGVFVVNGKKVSVN